MSGILLLNGPNINLLGRREPSHYGNDDLAAIEQRLREQADKVGATLTCLQSNNEAALIERIHSAIDEDIACILFNPAAFTHTSIALRDALLAVAIPFIEIHISNIHQRDDFRQHSYFSDIASGLISGLGTFGYDLALQAGLKHIATKD